MLEKPIHSIEVLPVTPPSPLFGRAGELKRLRDLVAAGDVVWLYGPSGIGRRGLAASVAAQFVERPGGVLWFSVYYDDMMMLSNRVARAYGISALATDDVSTQLDMAQALLEQNHPLLVLDGPLSVGVITQFLKQCIPQHHPVIITSGVPTEGQWTTFQLDKLNDKDAEQFYRHEAQLDDQTRTALLAPFLHYIQGHPLGLLVAAKQTTGANVTPTHFTSKLPETPAGPENRTLGVLAAAYGLLDAPAQGLFLLLGSLFTDRIGIPLLSVISGVSERTLPGIVQQLTKRGFCDEIRQADQPPLYRVHDLARTFARSRLQAQDKLEATRNRILNNTMKFVKLHAAEPNTTSYDILAREMDNLWGTARYAASTQQFDVVESLFKLLGQHSTQNVIHARGYQGFYALLGRLLTSQAEKPGQSIKPFVPEATQEFRTLAPETPPEEPVRMVIDTEAIRTLSRETLEIALEEATANNNRPQALKLAMALGDWYTRHKQPEEAVSKYQLAVTISHELGDHDRRLMVYENLAGVQLTLNEPHKALEAAQHAVEMIDGGNYPVRKGRIITVMGDAQSLAGEHDSALKTYQEAINILEKSGDSVAIGLAQGKLATTLLDKGDLQEATIVLAQSAARFEQVGRRDLQGRALGNLGTAFGRMGRWKEAGQRHTLALQIAREMGDIEDERFQLSNLAFVAEAEGYYDWAIYYSRQALYLALVAGDRASIAQITLDLGRLLLTDANQLPQAIRLLEVSVDLDPSDDAVRFLGRAKSRYERLVREGYAFVFAENDLQVYAQAAYETHS
ncbi:MAG: tetratricopeptide repeat protein [Chloroflexi bacterium]|nr:tetratricopeptide repeat protein [Chloroflexota bacterium]